LFAVSPRHGQGTPRRSALLLLAAVVALAADAAPPPADSPVDAYTEFRQLFDAGDYQAAAAAAQRVVELTEAASGDDPQNLQAALMNLAYAQRLSEDYPGAEASYLRVIALVETKGRPTDPRLARAYAGLANTYYAAGRHDIAVPAFETAVGITRRNEGLFCEEQLPMLERLAESLTELGRLEDAQRVQSYRLRVGEKRYGTVDERGIAIRVSVGRWYSRIRAYDPARRMLKEALEELEQARGPADIGLVAPLTALAECNRRQLLNPLDPQVYGADAERFAMFHDPVTPLAQVMTPRQLAGDGQRWLERAVGIVEQQQEPSPAQLADVRVQLGDWFQLLNRHEEALIQYREAWKAAQQVDGDGLPLAEILFGAPVLLHYDRPGFWDRYAGRPPEQIELRSVDIDLTVDASGLGTDPVVVDDAGDEYFVEAALEAAGTARYRPRFADGEPVPTVGVRFSQPFMVLIEPEEPAQAPARP
jgi:tetratricopeptide (TPR) repeat protein